ncbi:hypothetical protein UFOVP257_202 [uncultured Caudovirales phage]|uniref:Uncharacterized protein n=1 Tax=uncultured Caudovirales phage TaxID=2100421 RepID=A0A6J5LK55_9CAUD|nr:hypothetical protein UFOVP257_202 [uncultured Caudovirales phage]
MLLHEVEIVNIPNEDEVSKWAMQNCPSFAGWVICDDGDNHPIEDELNVTFTFIFHNELDALLFRMRWQGQQ